jgi:hypothetical protein
VFEMAAPIQSPAKCECLGGNAYGAIAVTVVWIQEYGENPMFHLQSQWSPETHGLPVSSA